MYWIVTTYKAHIFTQIYAPAARNYGGTHGSLVWPVATYGCYYYFASAAVAVDSSHMTASSSTSWSRKIVHRQILLMGTCRQCGSWSVAGHNHRKVIGPDPIILCKLSHDMGLDLSLRLWKTDTQNEWRNTSWRLWDERTEKDSAGFVDNYENKWVGS